MKKTQNFIAIISALMLCCIFLFSACISAPSKTDKGQTEKKKTSRQESVLKIDVSREKKQTERYEYSVELPRFPDYPELTALVRSLHDKRFAEFDRESAENFKAVSKGSLSPYGTQLFLPGHLDYCYTIKAAKVAVSIDLRKTAAPNHLLTNVR